MPPLRKRASQA